MLILTRKENESILLFKDDAVIAEITVLENRRYKHQTRIGIEADNDIVVLRDEVHERNLLEKDLCDDD